MAKLDKPFSIEQVKMFACVVDFYYWKGIPVARAWPRKPRQPNTPAQIAARQHFAKAGAWLKTLPAPFVEPWLNIDYPKGRTAKSYLRGLALRLSNRGLLASFPCLTSLELAGPPTPAFTAVRIFYDPTWQFDGDNIDFYMRASGANPGPLAWVQTNENVQKRCRSVGRFELNLDAYSKALYNKWEPGGGHFYIIMETGPEYIEIFPVPKDSDEKLLCLRPPFHGKVSP